ncbi:peptidylprolyl isomerase [Zhouia sp. PK063]|uniref:peptidylprolyl isomerase n=1 Tax=Zhouia sp. PK063 TaxID=3373602 RepID=UPI003789460A
MLQYSYRIFTILLLIFLTSCHQQKDHSNATSEKMVDTTKNNKKEKAAPKKIAIEDTIILNDDNVIPFLKYYGDKNPENKVKVTTKFGSFIIQLYENTPYHRANFIYLTKRKYFNGSYFYRVVKDFIIQGGDSDNMSLAEKRQKIGKYLLPPDTHKGHKHDYGTVSMPSSNIDNPYKLASPFEFFIVCQKPGAYHLDGNYTAFGKVIEGMDVVEKINHVKTGDDEWPLMNVPMQVEIVK